jgi:hypothetical protein
VEQIKNEKNGKDVPGKSNPSKTSRAMLKTAFMPKALLERERVGKE